MAATGYLIDTNVAIDYLGETIQPRGMIFMDRVIELTLITRNTKDFDKIDRLALINPYHHK